MSDEGQTLSNMDIIDNQKERIDELEDQLDEAVEALEEVEWIQNNSRGFEEPAYCPSCRNEKKHGHHEDCKLKKALSDLDVEGEDDEKS